MISLADPLDSDFEAEVKSNSKPEVAFPDKKESERIKNKNSLFFLLFDMLIP